jgi:linoleoyl-CoA desaturase
MDSTVKFINNNKTDFYQVLKKKVDDYFLENNLSKHANPTMVIKTIIILSLYIGPYLLIMSNRFSPVQMLFLVVLMGVGASGIGMSIMHDANHGAYSENPVINRLLGATFYLVGLNVCSWKITHNIKHHTYTNIYSREFKMDEDLEEPRYLRLSPNADLKPWHKYQHLYTNFLFSIQVLKWIMYRDFNLFFRRDYKILKNSGKKNILIKEIIILFGLKIIFGFFMVVLPLLILNINLWQLIIGLFIFNLVSGNITYTIFQLAHVVEKATFPLPENGIIKNDWAAHQLATTVNFARNNKILSWYIGGLNFQTEHHLFPQICHVHYPAISEIVKQTASEYNLPYNDYPTFFSAVRSHYRLLKKFGKEKNPSFSDDSVPHITDNFPLYQ